MNDKCLHRVPIKLKTQNIWDTESRLIEINQLRVWLDEITEWQPDMYELRYHSSQSRCTAWFEKEEHAVICALRWS